MLCWGHFCILRDLIYQNFFWVEGVSKSKLIQRLWQTSFLIMTLRLPPVSKNVKWCSLLLLVPGSHIWVSGLRFHRNILPDLSHQVCLSLVMNDQGPKYVSTQWESKQPRNDISNTEEWYNFRQIDIASLALIHQPRLHFYILWMGSRTDPPFSGRTWPIRKLRSWSWVVSICTKLDKYIQCQDLSPYQWKKRNHVLLTSATSTSNPQNMYSTLTADA